MIILGSIFDQPLGASRQEGDEKNSWMNTRCGTRRSSARPRTAPRWRGRDATLVGAAAHPSDRMAEPEWQHGVPPASRPPPSEIGAQTKMTLKTEASTCAAALPNNCGGRAIDGREPRRHEGAHTDHWDRGVRLCAPRPRAYETRSSSSARACGRRSARASPTASRPSWCRRSCEGA